MGAPPSQTARLGTSPKNTKTKTCVYINTHTNKHKHTHTHTCCRIPLRVNPWGSILLAVGAQHPPGSGGPASSY